VIRTFRAGGVEVIAIHNNLLTDHPRLFSMHFWAGDAMRLARRLSAALDKTNSAKP
jgi:hypothetical protein